MDERQIIFDKLQKAGFRVTEKRKIMIDAILSNEFSSIKEIHYEVNRRGHEVGIATVYRMINTLEEIGVIDRSRMYKVECGG